MAGLCPGHPRLSYLSGATTWMPDIADKFTQSAQGRLRRPGMTSFTTETDFYWLLYESLRSALLRASRRIGRPRLRDGAEFITGPRFARARWRLLGMRANFNPAPAPSASLASAEFAARASPRRRAVRRPEVRRPAHRPVSAASPPTAAPAREQAWWPPTAPALQRAAATLSASAPTAYGSQALVLTAAAAVLPGRG
jgi:hypothetical protein